MRSIKIGTRNSPLALWQAREVARNLQNNNYKTDITPIISSGDKNLTQPLYTMGITGIFTKDLDIALLHKEVDIAVHSLKDIPTQLPENLEIIAVLKRDYPQDVLVRKSTSKNKELHELKIATSSLRRRAFWAKHYPETEFFDIRGNVQTRLQKLEDQEFDATLFSLAAIERMSLSIEYEFLPIMISAPAQGVVAVTARADDADIKEYFKDVDHRETRICIDIERNFLRTLEGGCTAPIGAFAEINEKDEVRFIGRLCSLDGKQSIEIDEIFTWNDQDNFGEILGQKVLEDGGRTLMQEIKLHLQ
ncbi:hydroxymethylbilane synthase [Kaistella antarctica]|uniref:Hydroxymethylbilane synthase n=1 Tax=Kaistella antarctica TaxID=266748 RepID=A0A3S4UZ80_9FLAO|nr:hydroxymethylbilane synthase [Kaistella antarctica]KEY17984.1 porphobilinogen deaminase [Kaistella antarctica]SEV81874.1 hydroxymethylbilane synthase [Kaistella antarctica]VEI00444.1 Porphobilinogen deaminase [Kaistella antarctica]